MYKCHRVSKNFDYFLEVNVIKPEIKVLWSKYWDSICHPQRICRSTINKQVKKKIPSLLIEEMNIRFNWIKNIIWDFSTWKYWPIIPNKSIQCIWLINIWTSNNILLELLQELSFLVSLFLCLHTCTLMS